MKKIQEGHFPEEPISTPFPVGSSDTKSDNVVVYVDKRRMEADDERVKSKGVQKLVQKYLVKSTTIKGYGPHIEKQVAKKEIMREERIYEMKNQKA